MPVIPVPAIGRLCNTLLLVIATSVFATAQSLVGGSIFAPAPAESNLGNKLWLQYQNSFQFNDRMYIDTDFGHIFHSDARDKRLNIRSVFKYQLTENLKIGTGMGFFWLYDRPNLLQELRFVQEINYVKDFGTSILYQDLRFEERLSQGIATGDDFGSRIRFRMGVTIPTNSPLYFGAYDEIFKNLSRDEENPSAALSMNRAGILIGFDTHQLFKIEAHLMMEDRYKLDARKNERSFIVSLVVNQTI